METVRGLNYELVLIWQDAHTAELAGVGVEAVHFEVFHVKSMGVL